MKKNLNKFEPMAFVPIVRQSQRPKEALDALREMGVADVSLENRLEVTNEGEEAKITLMGAVGGSWLDDSGITEKEFRNALDAIPKGKPITITVNSEGGSVQEGLGIYNAISERKADIKVRIAGYALSIASVFPLAAKKSLGGRGVVSPKQAIWMQHPAWVHAAGNAKDLRQAANMLDVHDETLVDIYATATGKTKEQVRAIMDAETWTKGGDAVAAGLADETDEQDANASYRPLRPDFIAKCKNMSPEILNTLKPKPASDKTAAPSDGGQQQNKQENIMNKKVIVALLTKHGVKDSAGKDFTEQSTETELETALNTLATSKETPARLDAIEAKQQLAEDNRILARIESFVEAGKITNEEVPVWVDAAKKDEKKALAILNAKESQLPGGGAAGFDFSGRIEHAEVLDDAMFGMPKGITGLRGPLLEKLGNIRNEHKNDATKRHRATKENYAMLLREALAMDEKGYRKTGVMGANTYSGTLITSFLMDGSITDLQNVWAFLGAYSIAKDTDPYKPLAVGVLKHVTAAETTQTNPTNFEPNTGSTVAPISVTTAWYNQPMRVSATDLNSGLRMEDLRLINMSAFADKITSVATAPITAANFTATPLIRAFNAFGWSDMATLQGQLQKSPVKNFIANGNYIARIANTPGNFQQTGAGLNDPNSYRQFGWNLIAPASNWTGAGANINGFACNPQAIVRATGLPLNPPNIPGGVLTTSVFEVPGVGVAVAFSMWFSLATRTAFCSWDIIAGFAAADTTAGVVVATGAPS